MVKRLDFTHYTVIANHLSLSKVVDAVPYLGIGLKTNGAGKILTFAN